jgi:hypothetical protein
MFFCLLCMPISTIEIAMTTAKASSAPPGRRYGVVLQRALLRSARPSGFRFSGYSALAALSLSLSKARRASAVTLALSLSLFGAACAGPLAPVTHAADVVVREAPPSPRAACRVAARQAEITHGVPEGLLTAIALSESGLHAYALNLRGRAYFPNSREEASRMLEAAGGRGMAGCFQINAGVHAARGEDWPLDPPKAADWAARYLVRHYKDQGDWGRAVLRWHGASASRGTQIICRVHSKLEVTAPGSTLFADRCRPGAPQWARVRQNGAARLEVAEAAE